MGTANEAQHLHNQSPPLLDDPPAPLQKRSISNRLPAKHSRHSPETAHRRVLLSSNISRSVLNRRRSAEYAGASRPELSGWLSEWKTSRENFLDGKLKRSLSDSGGSFRSSATTVQGSPHSWSMDGDTFSVSWPLSPSLSSSGHRLTWAPSVHDSDVELSETGSVWHIDNASESSAANSPCLPARSAFPVCDLHAEKGARKEAASLSIFTGPRDRIIDFCVLILLLLLIPVMSSVVMM